MKRFWKYFTVLVAALTLTLACAVFAACGGTTYTIKVVLPDAVLTPVSGVGVEFSLDDEVVQQGTTNAEGMLSVTLPEDDYTVRLTSGIPEGYAPLNSDLNIKTSSWGSTSYLFELMESQAACSVTVLGLNNAPVKDVKVIFTASPADPAKDTESLTDENGKVSVSLPKGTHYLVTIDESTLPEGLALASGDKNGVSTANSMNITFSLVDSQSYTFRVSAPEGVNVSGLTIMQSATIDGANRTLLGTTNAQGELALAGATLTGYAFLNAPEGYVYSQSYFVSTETKACPYDLSKAHTVQFNLIKQTKLTLGEEMTEAERSDFAAATRSKFGFLAMGENDDTQKGALRKSYSFNASVPANETQLFSFVAEETGSYYLFGNFGSGNVKLYYTLNLSDYINEFSSKSSTAYMLCTEGETYYFTFTAGSSNEEVQFVLASPEEKNLTEFTMTEDDASVSLTILEDMPATLQFTPTVSGKYDFEIVTEGSYLIEGLSIYVDSVLDSSTDGTISTEVTRGNLYTTLGDPSGYYCLFRFSATGEVSYPLDITVSITRTDIVEQTYTVSFPAVTENLTQYGAQSGTLTAIGTSNTNDSIYKGSDGYYHYGSVNGPVVVVKLKGKIPKYYPDKEFENLDADGGNSYQFKDPDKQDTETNAYYVNYTRFLRGYYADENEADRFDVYYIKYVNDDGVYPLTDELKVFLKLFSTANAAWIKSSFSVSDDDSTDSTTTNRTTTTTTTTEVGATDDSLWLFSSYYYKA